MDRIFYWIYRLFCTPFRFISFSVLYKLSNGLTFLLQKVLKYRKSIVEGNISKCFPEMDIGVRQKVIHKSYLNFCDIFLESFKGPYVSDEAFQRRFTMPDKRKILDILEKGKSIILVGPHYANWEWAGMCFNSHIPYPCLALYKPLKNKYINAYVKRTRERYGVEMIDYRTTRTIFEKAPERPTVFAFVADQSPSNMKEAIWLNFMGNDTACLHGPEKYARLTGYPMVYLSAIRLDRGHYTYRITSLFDGDYEAIPYGNITKAFMSELENDIRRKPHDWLWSHKRWKRRREEASEQSNRLELKNS